jgi:hypothetical protein
VEPNQKRELLIEELEESIIRRARLDRYEKISVEHGRSIDALVDFHNLLRGLETVERPLNITLDITTFTKDLLLNLSFYLLKFTRIGTLRILYTRPEQYANPQEGWLSTGIRGIAYPPLCLNEWSPTKHNLLMVVLGFEEMRAWSLIDRFSADINWLFLTNPGSRDDWNGYCEQYNRRLLREIPKKDDMPALNPKAVSATLEKHITTDLMDTHNLFICPLGTKPQVVGILYYCLNHPEVPVNFITTTAVEHNIPFYSWGVGETFEHTISFDNQRKRSIRRS